jgi:hypothetical protein
MSAGSTGSPKQKEPPISAYIAGATLFVVVTWIFFVLLATPDERGSWAETIGSLFSGLAFVGVVAAIFLQREELALQRQELKDTRKELRRSAKANEEHASQMARQVHELEAQSRYNHHERIRQRRDQFLTARLNATIALLQVCQARAEVLDPDDATGFRRQELRVEITKLQQELAILKCESRLPISAEPWSPTIEARAIHAYLTDLIQPLSDNLLLPPDSNDGRPVIIISNVRQARGSIAVLSRRIRHSQPEIADTLKRLLSRDTVTADEAKTWIIGTLQGTLSVTNPIWHIPQPRRRKTQTSDKAGQ